MSSLPIADYGLVSDCHSAALVSRMGSVDWLCFPRFDAPSLFGRLLDDNAGHWSIHPTIECTTTRCYIDQTLVLETTFSTSVGKALLLDCMAVGKNERGHQLGAEAPHALLRSLRCTDGEMEFELEYAPRPEYGLVYPLLSEIEGGVRARGGASYLRLSSPVPVALDESTCRARFHLKAGQTASFALQHRSSAEPSREHWAQSEIDSRIEDTINAWRSWSSLHQNYQGPWQELVLQSGRILQGLTYYPTGAIVAAATTSLPETSGGNRNWDYRFCWVRDGSLTLEALWVAACPDEANKFFGFLTGAALTQMRQGVDLQIMFGIGGEHDLTERELPHLSGWRGSRPVRIGNGAWSQRQNRCLRRTLRFCLSVARTAAGSRWNYKGISRGCGRYRCRALERKRPGNLGNAWRAASLSLFQADVLGCIRSRHSTGRADRSARSRFTLGSHSR